MTENTNTASGTTLTDDQIDRLHVLAAGQATAEQQGTYAALSESFLEIPDVQDESGINAYYSREVVLECIDAALASHGQAPAKTGNSVSAQADSVQEDAARYRWLRSQACMSYPSSEGSGSKAAYMVVTGYGYEKRDEIVDAAVDAARKQGGKEACWLEQQD